MHTYSIGRHVIAYFLIGVLFHRPRKDEERFVSATMMSEFANQPLFLGILPCFLCNSIIDIFESLIQIISDSINHRYSIYIIDIESFYSILYQGITLQKYFLLFVLSLSRWLPPSLPSLSLLSFNHNIAQQRSRIQIYIIILLLGSMGFCCCATWYSNWMLNRDFRLMIRVEFSPFVHLLVRDSQGQPRFLKQIAKTSRNRCELVFSLVLSARRVNSICNDKQRPSMALIPCNWGWITICSPALHKGVYTVFADSNGRVDSTKRVGQGRGYIILRLFLISKNWFWFFWRYYTDVCSIIHFPSKPFPIKSFDRS